MRCHRHIIVTGADGMGKSTLVNTLATKYGVPYIGHEGAEVLSYDDAMSRLSKTREEECGIQDRCCAIDDPVYSKAFGRDRYVSDIEYEAILSKWDPVIIFVVTESPSISTERKSHKSPELLAGVIREANRIREFYKDRVVELKILGLQILEYDWTKDPSAFLLVSKLAKHEIID